MNAIQVGTVSDTCLGNRVDPRLDSFVEYPLYILLVVLMPRQKDGGLKGEQLKAARQGKSEKQAIAESDTALDDLWSNFNQSKACAEELEHKLADQVKICTDLQNDFNASQDLINSLHTEILSLKSKNSDIYHQLHMA